MADAAVLPGFDGATGAPKRGDACQDAWRRVDLPHSGATLVAVYDGHGPSGAKAAEVAAASLPVALRGKADAKALAEAFAAADAHVAGAVDPLSGTTACAVVVTATSVVTACVGDSCAVAARATPDGKWYAVPITAQPGLDEPAEQKRVEQAGGVVGQQQYPEGPDGPLRVFIPGGDAVGGRGPGLAMGRSLGDALAHGVGVTPEPVTMEHAVQPDWRFVLLASDGLWDVYKPNEAVRWVAKYVELKAPDWVGVAEALATSAQRRWKRQFGKDVQVDDCSVVIVRWPPAPAPAPAMGLPVDSDALLTRAEELLGSRTAVYAAAAAAVAGTAVLAALALRRSRA